MGQEEYQDYCQSTLRTFFFLFFFHDVFGLTIDGDGGVDGQVQL
jgi:hypothetical protein